MEKFLAGTERKNFIRPLGVVTENVCKDKGLKSTVATSSAYTEFFLSGTLPTKDCYGTEPSGTETPTPQATESPTETPTNAPEQPTATPSPTSVPAVETPTPTPLIVVPTL